MALLIIALVLIALPSFSGLSSRPASASSSLVQLAASPATSRVTRLQITRQEPYADGTSFGITGPYERLVGIAYLEADPSDPHNSVIQDINLAPRNSRGMVEYSTDIHILKPVDMNRSSRELLYVVVNRGNVGIPFSNPSNPGEGFLEQRGLTIVWSGWQADLVPGGDRLILRAPVARNTDGSPITGTVRAEYIVDTAINTLNLSSGTFTGTATSYETVSLDNSTATLTRRVREADPRVPVSNSQWVFADCTTTPFPGTPSTTRICVRDGFQPNFIYELIYTAKDPTPLGLGFAAVRDVISFLRNASADDQGTPNPLAGNIRFALTFGFSQSGRFIRSFLDLGFNQDVLGRSVFDGMYSHIAAGHLPLNVRFGQPGRGYLQYEDHLYPGYESPFTWMSVNDPLARQTASLLDRCQQQRKCPKIIQSVSSLEYWQGRMSLNTTDALGQHDVEIPENARVYLISSTQHIPAAAPAQGICQQLSNPSPQRETMRALFVALEQWVRSGLQPPSSQIPTLRDGTLVRPNKASLGWPDIAGVKYTGRLNELTLLDFGQQFDHRSASGIVREPPTAVSGRNYVVLVPKVDADGNEIAGIRSTTIQAPLGTYTGWNLRRAGFVEDELCGISGSYIPFARSKAERLAKGDPRTSLEERYGTHDGYVAAVRAAADRLVAQRLLQPEDAERLVREAQASNVLAGILPAPIWTQANKAGFP